MGAGGTTMVEAVGSTSGASVGRASGRTAIRVRTASPRRPSSATTAAIPIPNKDTIIDMLTPRSAILGSGHDAMVTKEFWPRSAPIAITNVALPRPNPILINAGHDALTLATSALDDARHHAPCKRIQACRQDAGRQARPAVAGGWRAGVATLKTQIRSVARAPAPASSVNPQP